MSITFETTRATSFLAARSLAGAVAALALVLPAQAGATVLFGNYDPSDTAATNRIHFLPLDYRAPDASQSFDAAADASAACANVWCSYIISTSVMTEFTAPTDFEASRLIVPIAVAGNYGNRRTGFSISHYDTDTSAWVGLGYMQVESGLLPHGQVLEVDVPLGESGARFIDYNYIPIQFEAGERYAISASGWAGAAGWTSWYLSDQAAAPGQSIQYSSHAGPVNLAYQPAFAFTDGGELTGPVSAVPEPAAWAMMILGVFGAGAALRRRRALTA
jgi:hypothetical protein